MTDLYTESLHMAQEASTIWVIYDKPQGYPSEFVARRWVGLAPTDDVLVADDLGALRKMLPPGLFPMRRNEGDDPVIVETWI